MRLKLILLFLTVFAVYTHGQQPAIMVQGGHTNRISSAAISSDDQLLATGGIDQTIHVWNLQTGKLLKQYTNNDAIYCLAFMPEKDILFSGCYGINTDAVKLWNLEDDSYTTLSMPRGGLRIAFSPGHKFLSIGNSRGSVALYDMDEGGTGLWYYKTEAEEVSINALAFSADESMMAAGTTGYSGVFGLYLYSTDNNELISNFRFESAVEKIHFINNEEVLVEERSWNQANILYHLNLKTGEKLKLLDMTSFVVLNNNTEVIGMTEDFLLGHFKLGSLEKIKEIPIRDKFIDEIALSNKEDLIVAVGRDVECLNVASGLPEYYIPGDAWIDGMSFSSEGNKLAFTADNGKIASWDLETGMLNILHGHSKPVRDLFYDKQGNYLASVSDDSTAIIWNQDGSIKHRISFHNMDFNAVSMNPSADWLAVSIGDSVMIFNVETGEFAEGYTFGVREAQKVIFSPNNRDMGYLVMEYLLVYNAVDGLYRIQKPLGTASLEDIAFSSDGRYVATSGYTDSLYVFDLVQNDTARNAIYFATALPENEYVNSLAIDPASMTLAAGLTDGSVHIYDIENKVELDVFREFGNLVNKLSFREDGKVLAASSWDGKLVLWNMDERIKMAELYAFEDGTWAVIDADGRYDASNAGNIEHIHFAVGKESISLDQLKERFYEPGLLQKLLGYESEPLRDVSRLTTILLYPETDLTISEDELLAKFTTRNGGIGRVQLFVNGKEIRQDLSPDLKVDSTGNVFTALVDLDQYANYLRESGGNDISVVVFNEENYLASPRITIDYVPSQLEQDKKEQSNTGFGIQPKLYGIVIGTSQYRGDKLDLQFADKDAIGFSDALEQTAKSLFGVAQVEIITLVTENPNLKPRKEDIEKAFDTLALKASPEDVLVVYMSGHGMVFNSGGNSQFHYLTMDMESPNIDDKVIRDAHTISSEELTGWINSIPVEKQVLILDACSSGQAIEDILIASKGINSGQIRALERLKDRTGMFILTGSASDKVSYEASRFGQSLLTYSLLSGMKGQALRDGSFVDVLSLFEHAVERVPQLAAYIGGIQKPILALPYGGLSFDIGKVDEKVHIELASIKPVFIRSNFQDEDEFDDVLGMSESIDEFFRHLASRAKSAELIFVDVNKYPDAYSIKGRYKQEQGTVHVQARVFKGKDVIGNFELTGQPAEMDGLIQEIIFSAQELVE